MATTQPEILQRISDRSARAAVIGGGYVGLPLALAIADAGFEVTVVDTSTDKVAQLNAGTSYVQDVPSERVAELVKAGRLKASTDYGVLAEVDCISICVPTPLNKTKDPDISYILDAARRISEHLKPGALVVLESTTYPGTTREAVLDNLVVNGRKAGRDFFLCFSPERIDPGNETWRVENTPKVIGGLTPECTTVGRAYYEAFIETIVPVSSTEAAEMVKLLENTYRAVNIALVNEVALMSQRLGLDTWEVIDAAATKPFGFMKFYPGPGIGGHCLPLDPLYLSWKLKMLDYNARFIALASEINSEMPKHVVQMVTDALNARQKSVKGSRVLLLGVAYKRDIGDVRESPALDILRLLKAKGARVEYNDPFVPTLKTNGDTLQSLALSPNLLADVDCVVVTTDHSEYDAAAIVEASDLVVDTRNLTHGLPKSDSVLRL